MNKDENKVFVITSGEYSDYRIERVFSARQKALEYLDTKDDDYRLEEYYLDEPIERQTQVFCISFELDEKKVRKVSTRYGKCYKDLIQVCESWCSDDSSLDIYVESDSKKRALKVASERYGAVIAGEQTMYPYLRVGVVRYYNGARPAYFDFNTGELVLADDQKLSVKLPDFIKVKRIDTTYRKEEESV